MAFAVKPCKAPVPVWGVAVGRWVPWVLHLQQGEDRWMVGIAAGTLLARFCCSRRGSCMC